MGRTQRVDSLFEQAVEERKKRLQEEDERRTGIRRNYSFRDITAMFGWEYLKGGRTMPYEAAVAIIQRGKRNRRLMI
jgi:hypothetical protein